MKKTNIYIFTAIIIGVLIVSIIISNDKSSKPYIPVDKTNAAEQPKEYDVSELTQSDMESIAEAKLSSNDGLYMLKILGYIGNDYTVKYIDIGSYSRSWTEENYDGKTKRSIRAYGTLTVYDKYGQYHHKYTFSADVYVTGTLTSEKIKDIAQEAGIANVSVNW